MNSILSLDCESNGLHGEAFAVGAVLFIDGRVSEIFYARCPIVGEIDPWVEDNVIPALLLRPSTAPTHRAMRRAFWGWWRSVVAHYPGVLVVADVGCPVEAGFLAACVADAPDERAWNGPLPLHEVSTLLLARGHDCDRNRATLCSVLYAVSLKRIESLGQRHDPVTDALVSGLCALKLLGGTLSFDEAVP